MGENEKKIIIAIDGPAASGKSTVAKSIANQLGLIFINSGAMYRAYTHHVLEQAIDPNDEAAVVGLLLKTEFKNNIADFSASVSINNEVITGDQLCATSVNDNVSAIAKIPQVRERLVAQQRSYADTTQGLVMEGRDIGSVVFPDATAKFYIDASPEVREQRRKAQGIDDAIAERDKIDSNRKTAPLTVAEDAVVIDSSDLSAEEVVAKALEILRQKDIA